MQPVIEMLIANWKLVLLAFLLLWIYFKIQVQLRKYSEQREFNKTESPIEEFLFEELRKRRDYRGFNYEVYSQVPCGPYRIDLAIYTRRGKVAIECDGKEFHSSYDQVNHDNKKDEYLKKRGWLVYRFSGSDIYRNRKKCIDEIEERINNKKFFVKKTTHMR